MSCLPEKRQRSLTGGQDKSCLSIVRYTAAGGGYCCVVYNDETTVSLSFI